MAVRGFLVSDTRFLGEFWDVIDLAGEWGAEVEGKKGLSYLSLGIGDFSFNLNTNKMTIVCIVVAVSIMG